MIICSPLTVAKATLDLDAGEWLRLGHPLMISPFFLALICQRKAYPLIDRLYSVQISGAGSQPSISFPFCLRILDMKSTDSRQTSIWIRKKAGYEQVLSKTDIRNIYLLFNNIVPSRIKQSRTPLGDEPRTKGCRL